MAEQPTCATCRYWHSPEAECRRYAPNSILIQNGYQWLWPETAGDAWCGEHARALKESKNNDA